MPKVNKMSLTKTGWGKPSPYSEEAMTDRLVDAHKRGEHDGDEPIRECPLCDPDLEDEGEFWEERGIGVRRICEGCGSELAEYETTKTCRNCAR